MSFDPIANGWRKLLKNGGVGYIEPGKVFTFDGNIEGKDTVEIENMKLYYIANEAPDLNTIVKVRGVMDGQMIEAYGEDFEVKSNSEDGLSISVAWWSGAPFALSSTLGGNSVLFVHPWLRYIEFEDIIQPIDPKYLPEAMPKVIDLSKYSVDGSTNGSLALPILMLYMQGGGQTHFENPNGWDSFWNDVAVNRSLRIILPTEVAGGMTVQTDEVTVIKDASGGVGMLSFAFMFNYDALYSIKVVLNNGVNDININVIVETVTVPSA